MKGSEVQFVVTSASIVGSLPRFLATLLLKLDMLVRPSFPTVAVSQDLEWTLPKINLHQTGGVWTRPPQLVHEMKLQGKEGRLSLCSRQGFIINKPADCLQDWWIVNPLKCQKMSQSQKWLLETVSFVQQTGQKHKDSTLTIINDARLEPRNIKQKLSVARARSRSNTYDDQRFTFARP